MWGDSNWKLEDLVDSHLNYVNQRIPLESRYVRANKVPCMNKTISKAIMVSRLRNKYMKNMSEENKRSHTRQKSYCVKFFRKEKKNFFVTLVQKILLTTKPLGKL